MFDDEYENVCLDDLFLMQSHVHLDYPRPGCMGVVQEGNGL